MIEGNRIYLRPFEVEDASALLRLQRTNRTFFEQFSMERRDHYYTMDAQVEKIRQYAKAALEDQQYNFGIFTVEKDRLIGTISLFQVMRGALQSAFIGYFLDKAHNGQGFTTEAAQLLVAYAFEFLKLHRIEAGVMPHNEGSIRVLEKAGFHKEGIARQNVKINGRWEDHQVLALINPEDS
ncbi:GNAT family N-acetyltransferase [Halobacillus sp. A5]|uniref:GNAT family N-acetyltransferase n=1 Tax=Halobacillus sp. A5 TaxID=2880263 RepID=UPI0020A6D1FA|nr:GNAT family protein [Halobacillus sp. A5]MCP3027162.1 GNAT family N-acetyltransferase [Halobacillus sp. A5]